MSEKLTIIFVKKAWIRLPLEFNRSRHNAARKYLLRSNEKQRLLTSVWGC